MTDKLCFLVCEKLKREADAVVKSEGFDDVVVMTYLGECQGAQVGWPALVEQVFSMESDFQRIDLMGGACCADLQAPPRQLGRVYIHQTDQCSHMFIGGEIADRYLEEGTYLLLPGQLTHGSSCIGGPGSDEGAARDWLGPSVERLLLLDTGVDPLSSDHLQAFADARGLPFDILPVGLDHFRLFLTNIVQEWRLQLERGSSKAALSDAIRRSADHAMALDLIGDLTRIMTEEEVIESILDLFTMLFVPARLAYLPLVDDKPGSAYVYLPAAKVVDGEVMSRRLADFRTDYAWTESGDGFLLRIAYQNETVGILEIEGIALAKYKEHYLNLALIISRVCGLAISNARTYQKMREAEETIKYLAYHDALTRLPNRILFNDRFSVAIARSQRYDQRLAVLLLDLDGFKEVNDNLGHSVGDRLLQDVGRRLAGIIRKSDTVARIGGDEFILLLSEVAGEEAALCAAQRVEEALREPFSIDEHQVSIGSSIGIALYPDDGKDADTLLRHADMAMYRVKNGGKGSYQRYQPESD